VASVALPGWASADPVSAAPALSTPALSAPALSVPDMGVPAVPTDPVAIVARAALAMVESLPPTPNTAYGLDSETGQLVLTLSDAAPEAGLARLRDVADRFDGFVRVERTTKPLVEQDIVLPPLRPQDGPAEILGGDSINNGKIVCSAGFNTVRDGQNYLLTAGHCTAGMPDWQGIGPSVVSAFPTTDYGVIRDDSAYAPGGIDLYDGTMQPITDVGTATVGEAVCASGQTTKVTCGHVTAVDQTVNYGDGNVVHGLIKTDVHTDSGDSGGPLYTGSTGLGTVSGGDGKTDFFMPLAAELAGYKLQLAPVTP
jgi:streptogrisin D